MLNMKAGKPVRLTCPKKGHSRYNPQAEGQNGIKSGCAICTQIYAAFGASMKLYSEVRGASNMIAEYKRAHEELK